MSSDYDNLKSSGKLDQIMGELNANLEFAKEQDQPSPAYTRLADKYEQALGIIEVLKTKIESLEKNKIPTKDEVESMSAMLDLLDKFDPKTLEKISSLNKQGSNGSN